MRLMKFGARKKRGAVMHYGKYAKIGGAAIAVVTLGFAAATMAKGGGAKKAKVPDIYYKTQAEADAALDQFDKDNPSCQLWTNWQKMCSRTGENGTTLCVTDPNRSVRPSVPFCDAGVLSIRKNFSQKQLQSVWRYCTQKKSKSNPTPKPCANFLSDRPFSGYTVAARRHRFCNEWSDGSTGRKICSETNESGILSCEGFDEASTVKKTEILFCSSYNNVEIKRYIQQKNPSRIFGYGELMIDITGIPLDLRGDHAINGIHAELENDQ
jgi:hypothetical protein